ncbi:CRISPR-associated protein Cas4 [Eggerthella sinensis]|uniref:CRISPR-associated protein Cas4 n=1 Tax=Eggerthella sinensis TaxID=242230 RepID=UPI0022E344DF|nr:CRISPR-associated protein Cas4 [Eggerthella sinensis]
MRGIRSERGYRLVSRTLGISGIADVVEFAADVDAAEAAVRPVEYKVRKPKIEEWDRIQVRAQALCLEEMLGCAIEQGDLFYGATRRRERVALDESLRERVCALARRMHELFDRGETPRVERGSKCRRCSLTDSCLPEAYDHDAVSYWKEAGFEEASQHALRDQS